MTSDNNDPKGVAIDEAFNVLENQDTQALLNSHQEQLAKMNDDTPANERYSLLLDIASDFLALEQKQDAWDGARACFDFFIADQDWQKAAECCNVMFQCEMDDSVVALAHGVWIGVTFPIQPDTSVALLQHIIDETPDNSDGAAVAAMTAHYIADMRCDADKAESLKFLTTQMIAKVAQRHSQVNDQEMLDFWIERMELNDPALFLPKLAKVLDILVSGNWWFDRDELRKLIPDN
jgi:hypothetical protein